MVETKNWRKKINNELGAGAERMNLLCRLGLHKWRHIAEYTSRLPTMRKVRAENHAWMEKSGIGLYHTVNKRRVKR